MKILKYKLEIYQDTLALTHGWKTKIEEICVPELNLIVNKDHAFLLDRETMIKRVKSKKLKTVSSEDEEKFRKLAGYAFEKDKIQEKLHEVHNQIKEKFFTAEIY